MKLSNFLFHRVSPYFDDLWPPMHPKLFEKYIKYISSHYTVIKTNEINEPSSENKPLATLSFDDGYLDNYEYALPILEKYNCSASFFIVTNCIDKNIPTWTYIFDYKMQHSKKLSWKINFESVPKRFQEFKWNSKLARKLYAAKLKPILKKIEDKKREQVVLEIFQSLDDVTLPSIMMNWDQIRDLKNKNHEIGSHTLSHKMLGKSSNKSDIYKELLESSIRIQKMLGTRPTSIAYPIGSYNKTTVELAKKAGYKRGFAVHQRPYRPEIDDVYAIPRIELYNESWFKTKLRMNGVLEILKKILNK
jgi:peptidoglycan/xylan/chitin deacetylase (PgdA/CDA1 family)